MNYDIQCYMQRQLPNGTLENAINTKTLCGGMYVLEAVGLADYGKPKNIVTESYAEGDSLKYYIPQDGIKREATDVSIKMLFLDEGSPKNRYEQYNDMVNFLKDKIVIYWDSVRKRKARLLLDTSTQPKENFKGSIPYIESTFKFKNIDGYSVQVDRWQSTWSVTVCVKVDGLNNGKARYTTLTLSCGDIQVQPQKITDAFGTQSAITTQQLAEMGESAYQSRLSAYSNYVYSYMSAGGYIDFADDVTSVKDGAYGDSDLCPVE